MFSCLRRDLRLLAAFDLPFEHKVDEIDLGHPEGESSEGTVTTQGVRKDLRQFYGHEFMCEIPRGKTGRFRTRPGADTGEVLQLSGCRDDQEAADTNHFTDGLSTGAMTFILVDVVEKLMSESGDITFRRVLQGLLDRVKSVSLRQVPQLTTSHEFNLDSSLLL